MIDFGDKVYVNYRGEKVIDFSYGDKLELKKGMFDNHTDVQILMMNIDSVFPEGIFDNLVNLKKLEISNIRLILLDRIFDNLVNLESLYLPNNKLTSLSEGIFDNLVKLEDIVLFNNKLTSLPKGIFNNLVNLKYLNISHNKLNSIPYNIFNNLENLEKLYLYNNKLTSLPLSLRNCRRLDQLYYYNNPIEYIPPQLQRFLDRMENRAIQSISKDNQNVHNSAIQRSLSTSISNLLKEKPSLTTEEVVTFIANNEIITPEAKSYLLTYSEDETIHSVHDVTFSEVLTSVISEIISMKEELSSEVLKILSEEISDSICKCFTGRISRLVNSLNGFSPKVKVEISKNTQISTILAQTSEKISIAETEEEITKIKEETIKNLREHDFTEEEIEDWMSYL